MKTLLFNVLRVNFILIRFSFHNKLCQPFIHNRNLFESNNTANLVLKQQVLSILKNTCRLKVIFKMS